MVEVADLQRLPFDTAAASDLGVCPLLRCYQLENTSSRGATYNVIEANSIEILLARPRLEAQAKPGRDAECNTKDQILHLSSDFALPKHEHCVPGCPACGGTSFCDALGNVPEDPGRTVD